MLDQSLQDNVLFFYYRHWLEHPLSLTSLRSFMKYIDKSDMEMLKTCVSCLADQKLIEHPLTSDYISKITVFGVHHVEESQEFPDNKIRTQIIGYLKKIFEFDAQCFTSNKELENKLNLTQEEVWRNLIMLEHLWVIDLRKYLGGKMDSRIRVEGADIFGFV